MSQIFWSILTLLISMTLTVISVSPLRATMVESAPAGRVFPGTQFTEDKTVKVTWYDGDQRPPKEIQPPMDCEKFPDQGSLFIGTKGSMLLPHIARAQLFPEKDFENWTRPKVTENNHWLQFVEACRGNGQNSANFNYAGPLTETILLGGLATHFPQTTLQWNAKKLKFSNASEANPYVRRRYRKGWEVKGLS